MQLFDVVSMYSPKHVLIQTFIQNLQDTYQAVFGCEHPAHLDCLKNIAQTVLETLTQSDAFTMI